jgi:hypothetical protein
MKIEAALLLHTTSAVVDAAAVAAAAAAAAAARPTPLRISPSETITANRWRVLIMNDEAQCVVCDECCCC